MPIGGLSWRDELEEREFKKVKSGIQVFGIDDAPFAKDDKEVKVIAVLSRGGRLIESVFNCSVEKDGLDATSRLAGLLKEIKRENARAIILDGITFGGFNIVDIKRLYRETGIPVIVSMTKRPDSAAFRKALKNLPDEKERLEAIRSAGAVHTIVLGDGSETYIQTAGISKKDAEEIIRSTTINGKVPEPVRAAHNIAKGAYTEIRESGDFEELPVHEKAYHYVKHQHKRIKRLKRVYLPGVAGEIASFLFAFLVAWLIIQLLGLALGTPIPLVVVESGSMIHDGDWEAWQHEQDLDPASYPYKGGLGIGDIVLIKGDETDDIRIGDVIVYTKYSPQSIGGEPIIHRVVGILKVEGEEAFAYGAIEYDSGEIKTPCNEQSSYTMDEIERIYSTDAINRIYPGIGDELEDFRLFFTKGDNPSGNFVEDQCKLRPISLPIHERLVQGRAKVAIPYLGYVKLGIVCAARYATGTACECTCWWPKSSPRCCA